MSDADAFVWIATCIVGWLLAFVGWVAFAVKSGEAADARAGWSYYEAKYYLLKDEQTDKEEATDAGDD